MPYPIGPAADAMRRIAKVIGMGLSKGWGFALLVFEYGGPGTQMHYISSAQRQDMIRVLQEQIRHLQAGDN